MDTQQSIHVYSNGNLGPVTSVSSSTVASTSLTTLVNPDLILKEDTLECYSRNGNVYRILMTETELLFQPQKQPQLFERYSLEDLFGVQTYRHKRNLQSTPTTATAVRSSHNGAAFLCFTFYPKIKCGVLSNNLQREKTQIVLQVKKNGNSFEENLEEASIWKLAWLNYYRDRYCPDETSSSFQHSSIISNNEILPHVRISNETILWRKLLVILNPKSGQGKTLSIFKDTVYPILCECGVKTALLITEYAGHAYDLVINSDLSDIHGIITVGGDGLLHEVVNGLRSRNKPVIDIPVGVIAGGSGNGLARSIAFYSGEGEDYLKNAALSTTLAIARGRVFPVNLLEIELDAKKIYSFLSVGWGILSDIDIESEVIRSIGESRFTLWSLLRIAKLRTYKAQLRYTPKVVTGERKVEDGDKVISGEFISVYSSCQSHIGSDIIFAPLATRNDGLIHLTIVKGDIGRGRVIQFLLGLGKGSHLDVPGVDYIKVEEFSIHAQGGIHGSLTVDGEKVNAETIRVRMASNPLNVFAM